MYHDFYTCLLEEELFSETLETTPGDSSVDEGGLTIPTDNRVEKLDESYHSVQMFKSISGEDEPTDDDVISAKR